jgi:hypothetical protein
VHFLQHFSVPFQIFSGVEWQQASLLKFSRGSYHQVFSSSDYVAFMQLLPRVLVRQ